MPVAIFDCLRASTTECVLKYVTDKIYELTQIAAKRLFLTDNFDK